MYKLMRRHVRRTTVIAFGTLGVLAGLCLGRFGQALPWLLIVCALLPPLLFVYRKTWLAVLCAVAIGLLLGYGRGAHYMQRLAPYTELYNKKVTMRVVAREDAVYAKNGQISFDADHVYVQYPSQQQLPGRLRVSGYGVQMVYRGDSIVVQGKLYATRGGRQGGISFAQLEVVARNAGVVDTARRAFATGMQNALPEPLASFGLGILVGQRSTLPESVAQQLSVAGLTHLVAVSGYNLTIIVQIVRRLMAGRSKFQGVCAAGLLIGMFLLMTGMSPSIVRAALVSGLSVAAWYYGRNIRPVLLIGGVAAVTALWNPLYIWSDIGWYLSFLAFTGVIVLAPLVLRKLYKDREPRLIPAVLAETTCAQLLTLPLILYIFQQMSLVSILSNVLVVPLVPLAMVLSLLAGMAGMIIPEVAGWFAWPARLVLTYCLDVAHVLARVPHALVRYSLDVPGLIVLYSAIVGGIVVLARSLPKKHGIITDKNSNIDGV